MKTNKLILSILTGSLILTSATAFLDNSNFVEAKRQNNRTKVTHPQKKKAIKREYLSKEETKKIIDTMLKDGIITKDRQLELYSMLEDKGFFGWVWVEFFNDNAKDVHIPGWMVTAGGAATIATVSYGISLATGASATVGAILKTGNNFIPTAANLIVGTFSSDLIKNGIVLYMVNPHQKLVCAGGNCYYDTVYDFHHARIDY